MLVCGGRPSYHFPSEMAALSRFMWFFMLFSMRICNFAVAQNQNILNETLCQNDYNVNLSPQKPTEVSVQIYINSFGSLDAANMDYRIDIFLRQTWRDARLNCTKQYQPLVIQDPIMRDRIWKPDSYFLNVKTANIHMVTMPNVLFRINDTDEILYSMRVEMVMECLLQLHDFPFDSHKCSLKVSSYSNTDDVLKYKWHKENPVKVPQNLQIGQFDYINYTTDEERHDYATGYFSGLQVYFILRRQRGYHVLQTYIPTILIVCISWISFWFDPNAVPGRTTLGVTTLLTLATLATGTKQQLPPVAYVKAIDIWIGMCMAMVFGALLEFTVVNWLANASSPKRKINCNCNTTPQFDMAEEGIPSTKPATYINAARTVDKISRFLFPSIFLIFNFVYWWYFLTKKTALDDENCLPSGSQS